MKNFFVLTLIFCLFYPHSIGFKWKRNLLSIDQPKSFIDFNRLLGVRFFTYLTLLIFDFLIRNYFDLISTISYLFSYFVWGRVTEEVYRKFCAT